MRRKEELEVVRGRGNVFRDLGRNNADAEQFKAMFANEIIQVLDREHLTVRVAHAVPASPRPISLAFATPISDGSPLTGSS